MCNYDFSSKGRIWIVWCPLKVQLEVVSSSEQIVHCKIRDCHDLGIIFVSFVYGLHCVGDRKRLWAELSTIAACLREPWVVIGNFNSVFDPAHRKGGNPIVEAELMDRLQWMGVISITFVKSTGAFFS